MTRSSSLCRPAAALFVLITGVAAACAGDAAPPAKPPATQTVVSPAPKPFLGVNVDENSANFDPTQGLPITVVIPGSTAASLGLTPGDHLLTFNSQALHAQSDLLHALQQVKVDDTIAIQYTRKQGEKSETKNASGPITERPQVKTLTRDLSTLRDDVQRLRSLVDDKKQKEISLVEVLRQLKELEQNLPAAVADFKKQYPNGEFNISIKIDIVSDKTAKQVIEIGNQPSADLKTSDPAAKAGDKSAAPAAPAAPGTPTTPAATPKP